MTTFACFNLSISDELHMKMGLTSFGQNRCLAEHVNPSLYGVPVCLKCDKYACDCGRV